MVRHYTSAEPQQPPRQAAPATPPQEGNGPALYLCRYEATTPSGCACHPSTGGELPSADTPQPPRQIEPPIEPVGQSAILFFPLF